MEQYLHNNVLHVLCLLWVQEVHELFLGEGAILVFVGAFPASLVPVNHVLVVRLVVISVA